MSRLSSFVLGLAIGAGALYTAMHFHVVRAGDGLHLVGKLPPRLAEAYVDIRQFDMADWTSRPQLTAALVQADKQHLIGQSAAQAIHSGMEQLFPGGPNQ